MEQFDFIKNIFMYELLTFDTFVLNLFNIIYIVFSIYLSNLLRKLFIKMFDDRIQIIIELNQHKGSKLRTYLNILSFLFFFYILILAIDFNTLTWIYIYNVISPFLSFNFIQFGSFHVNILLIIQLINY